MRYAYVDSNGKHTYTIYLTRKTLASDWHDSVLHELLHVFFWETLVQIRKRYKNRINQSDALEEVVVSLFSHLVTRR